MQELRKKLLSTCLHGDAFELSHWIEHVKELDIHPVELFEDIIRPTMYQVGELWEKNKITVAEEHLITASMDYVISSFFQMPYFHKEKRQKPRIVLSCVEREEHSMGIKMVGRVFEEYKWDVKLLGANLPKEYLLHAINVWNPKMVGLSLSTPALIPELASTVREIKQKSPNTHILVGGRLSDELQQMKEMEGVQLCNSLHHLKDFIQNPPLENV